MKPIGSQLDHPCPECGLAMVLRRSRFGLFYGCVGYPECKAAHGAHKNTGEPLGTPATADVKAARIKAHDAFDRLWRGRRPRMDRTAAYSWMADVLGIAKSEAHIGRFDKETCERLIAAVEAVS